jgi:hypothetical protein
MRWLGGDRLRRGNQRRFALSMNHPGLSAGAYDKIMRVFCTIAHLDR